MVFADTTLARCQSFKNETVLIVAVLFVIFTNVVMFADFYRTTYLVKKETKES